MSFKNIFRRTNGSAALNLFAQEGPAAQLLQLNGTPAANPKLPNAIRVITGNLIKTADKSAKALSEKIEVTHEQIALEAWYIWQREGCPENRAFEHWVQAEKELQGK